MNKLENMNKLEKMKHRIELFEFLRTESPAHQVAYFVTCVDWSTSERCYADKGYSLKFQDGEYHVIENFTHLNFAGQENRAFSETAFSSDDLSKIAEWFFNTFTLSVTPFAR